MRITAVKVLSATQIQLVSDACEKRGVDARIEDHGAWIRVKMTGETDAIAAAWAEIRAGRNECDG